MPLAPKVLSRRPEWSASKALIGGQLHAPVMSRPQIHAVSELPSTAELCFMKKMTTISDGQFLLSVHSSNGSSPPYSGFVGLIRWEDMKESQHLTTTLSAPNGHSLGKLGMNPNGKNGAVQLK